METSMGTDMEADRPPTFGALLKRHRRAACMTLEALAERSQVSAHTIGNLERAAPHQPRRDTIHLLAQALSLTPEQLSEFVAAAGALSLARATGASGASRATTPPRTPIGSRPPGESTEPTESGAQWLPRPPTALVGRDEELGVARALLARDDVRILTLCGIGGVGKTHLGLTLAREVASGFRDGAYFVDLAPVRDPDDVARAIARTLELRVTGRNPLTAQLCAYLRDKQALLALDNFEHVVRAAPLLAELCAAAPAVKVLVTSRAALHLRGEQELPLQPLALPDPDHLPPLAELAQIAAVTLFAQRARLVQPDFALTPHNAPAVAAICRRVEGLPLAIELAAARLRLFTPHELLVQLERRLPLLSGGAADLPERQRSLDKSLAWSYELLDAPDRALLCGLAIFVGGCSLAAAEAVVSAGAHSSDHVHILEGATRLLDHHLVERRPERGDAPRIGLLETIREYAQAQLAARDDRAAMERAHAAYYLALAETAQPWLTGPDQARWLTCLEDEYGNLDAALAWIYERQDGEMGLRFIAALWRFWLMRGRLAEGRTWIERMLQVAGYPATVAPHEASDDHCDHHTCDTHEGRTPSRADSGVAPLQNPIADQIPDQIPDRWPRLRALALHAAGTLAYQQNDLRSALGLSEASLRMRRTLGDQRDIAHSANNLGLVYSQLGRWQEAAACFDESLTLKRSLNDQPGIASTLNNLGLMYLNVQHWDDAATTLEQSLNLQRQIGNGHEVARTLANLGQVALHQQRMQMAEALLQESLTLRHTLDDPLGVAHAEAILGDIALAQGHVSAARHWYEQALDGFERLHADEIAVYIIERFAEIWAAQERYRRAARLCGAASAMREQHGIPRDPLDQTRFEGIMQRLRQSLAKNALSASWNAGMRMPRAAALAEARADGADSADGADLSTQPQTRSTSHAQIHPVPSPPPEHPRQRRAR
jgi:predicted ATPase/transcriptional regulator with XRE-family HTH domain